MKNFKKNVALYGFFAALSMFSASSMAAIDVTGVNTAITAAEASAHTVGTTIITVVAGLAVIGIVMGLVRGLR